VIYYILCSEPESVTHLFLVLLLNKYYFEWDIVRIILSLKEVLDLVISLLSLLRKSFLVVFCVVCWSLWKHRNGLVFNSVYITSVRNIICLIM
jgi:hypothetical protein